MGKENRVYIVYERNNKQNILGRHESFSEYLKNEDKYDGKAIEIYSYLKNEKGELTDEKLFAFTPYGLA